MTLFPFFFFADPSNNNNFNDNNMKNAEPADKRFWSEESRGRLPKVAASIEVVACDRVSQYSISSVEAMRVSIENGDVCKTTRKTG